MQTERVRAFKNQLRNYNYNLSRITSLENSIEWLYDRLGGLRGIDPSKEPLHIYPNTEFEWEIREKIERLEAQKKRVEAEVQEMDNVLNRIENPLKWAIISIYVHNKRTDRIAMELNLSHNGLHYRINRAIEEALED